MSQSRPVHEFSAPEVEQWKGEAAFDNEKNKLGQIEDIYLDANNKPRWMVLKIGSIKASHVFAPAIDAFHMSDGVHLAYDQEKIKNAPKYEPKGSLDAGGEEGLTSYFGIDDAAENDKAEEKAETPLDEMPIPEPVSAPEPKTSSEVTLMEEELVIQKRQVPKKTVKLEELVVKSNEEIEQTLQEGTPVVIKDSQ